MASTVDIAPDWKPESRITQGRYDRIAPVYDLVEWPAELLFSRWRKQLWNRVEGQKILEVGVGTGKNIRFHPPNVDIVAIDISPRMLKRARTRADKYGSSARLALADVQDLPYADETFDAAVATFVFCSVPDPIKGLREVRRVLKPNGQLYLIEHVLSKRVPMRWLMRALEPVSYRIWGAHIDRDTARNVVEAGFENVSSVNMLGDVVKRIWAVRGAVV